MAGKTKIKTTTHKIKMEPKNKIDTATNKNKNKYSIGAIVYISKDADADLDGFKLFPQYKKCTYTVEAYDEATAVYTLRRLNLALRLPERLIIGPEEKAHDEINKKQF